MGGCVDNMMRIEKTQSDKSYFHSALINLIYVIPGVFCMMPVESTAYVDIAPPVPIDTTTQLNPSGNAFKFTAEATLHSELRWRGMPITASNPGLSTKTEVAYNHGRFVSLVNVNTYSYSMDTPASQPVNTLTDNAYLMTESRIGTRIIIGNTSSSSTYLELARTIYQWPGGTSWKYVQETCTNAGTTSTYITESQDISPVKTSDITLNLFGLTISYSMSNLSGISTSDALSRQLFEDYFHIVTKPHQLSKSYSVHFEYGYSENTGQHYDFNINFNFDKAITGTLKLYEFKTSTTTFDDQLGLIAALHYNFA